MRSESANGETVVKATFNIGPVYNDEYLFCKFKSITIRILNIKKTFTIFFENGVILVKGMMKEKKNTKGMRDISII